MRRVLTFLILLAMVSMVWGHEPPGPLPPSPPCSPSPPPPSRFLNLEVPDPEDLVKDYPDMIWTATPLRVVEVKQRKWLHTANEWGIEGGDPGLAIYLEIPLESIDLWDMQEGWPISEVRLAGVYVKNWALVTSFAKRDYLRAIGKLPQPPFDSPDESVRHDVWPITQSCQGELPWPKVQRNDFCAPGSCRAEWMMPPDESRQLVVLAHWDGHGITPEVLAAKIREGHVLKGWIYKRTRKKDPADHQPK